MNIKTWEDKLKELEAEADRERMWGHLDKIGTILTIVAATSLLLAL
jgi:hypothetical protein